MSLISWQRAEAMGTPLCWPPGFPGPVLWLLFLLLSTGVPGLASLRILEEPEPMCWQLGLHCRVKNSTCMDNSWIHPQGLTPSFPKHVQVQLRSTLTQHGDLLPVLHIEWTLKTDDSVLKPKGVMLSVLELNTKKRLCMEFEFLSKLKPHTQWRLDFSHFVVDPGAEYEVTIQHLPKPFPDGDPNQKSWKVLVPDCKDSQMKITTPCVKSGSLWDPNITVEVLEAHQLRASFTLGKESTHYLVLLQSFPHTENQSCFEYSHLTPAPREKEFQQRASFTLPLPHRAWCCRHEVQIQPLFSSCFIHCLRHTVTVPCPEALQSAGSASLRAYRYIPAICIAVVSFLILIVYRCWRKPPGIQRDADLTPTQEVKEKLDHLLKQPQILLGHGSKARPVPNHQHRH